MEIDYQKLGLKCGIEIHQQLDTHKLFCECPSLIRDDEPDIMAIRKMRAVAGELGAVDPAALHEFLRNREFVYQAYSDTNCLVELDEEPPHPLNPEALEIALAVSILLNAKPVDELQVMRKTVIDGSNTSGFQRTVLVAMDGYIETSLGKIGVPTICLEEDAARKISEEKVTITYRLDRLGIPLVEIATTPDIKTPEHAREVAEKIGTILRACRVKRGLGTIRQDLNISVSGGERIEVKGVQELNQIANIVENEVKRQLMLIEVKNELTKKNVKKSDIGITRDVSEILKKTESKVMKKELDGGGVVLALVLPGFSGLLKNKLGPELAQYANAYSGIGGLFHSDELPAYGITRDEVDRIKLSLKIKNDDAFVLVAGDKKTAEKAIKAVIDRAKIAFDGVPKETRAAFEDMTKFMRPLPGSERMYPETDEPLIEITNNLIGNVSESLPELISDRAGRYEKLGLSRELAGQISKSREAGLFDTFLKKFKNVKPSIIATILISSPKEARKRYGVDVSCLNANHFEQILSLLNDKKISKERVPELMAEIARNPDAVVGGIIKEKNFELLSETEIEKIVERAIRENSDLVKKLGKKSAGQLIGKVMAELRGRADAETVSRILTEKL